MDLKELEQKYKKSQIAVTKALKHNSVCAFQLFQEKQKQGVPLVKPASKKRSRKVKEVEKPKVEEPKPKEKKPKTEKKKRGRPAAEKN